MVDHVMFLVHSRLYGMLQHNHWGIDGWVPFAKYWGPGRRIDVHHMSQRSTDTSDRIHYH